MSIRCRRSNAACSICYLPSSACWFPVNRKSVRQKKNPKDNRFTSTAVAKNLDEPMEFKFLGDGRILFVERRGKIKVLDPATGQMDVIADIPVSIGYYSLTGEVLEPTGEDGMEGLAVDPDFDKNRWIYLYY